MNINHRKTRNDIKFGSLNVRGMLKPEDKMDVVMDMYHNKIQVLGIQETHIKGIGNETIRIKTEDNKIKSYDFFYTNSDNDHNHGVGIIVEKVLNATFESISERICKATIQIMENTHRKVCFISCYAPTLVKSEEDPEVRENFYEQLESTIQKIANRDILVVSGDFNAKTGTGKNEFPEEIGKFGKGLINSNGRKLLETAKRLNLVLTNTLFDHKMAHRTTWVCPERIDEHRNWDGTIRRNPYRNQIDYILVRKTTRRYVTDSRSYSGISKNTDHYLVKMTMKLLWYERNLNKGNNNKLEKLDKNRFKDENVRKQYQEEVKNRLVDLEDKKPQEIWDNITKICIEAAVNSAGIKKNGKKSQNSELIKLSSEQKKIKLDINSTRSKVKRRMLKTKRNVILKRIHEILIEEETRKIQDQVQEIEKYKDDSTRMFQSVRALNQSKEKESLIINGEEGLVTNEEEQVKIITDFFEKMFNSENLNNIRNIQATKMKSPFTSEEIKQAVKSLKNNKSPGIDQICSEMIKYGPEELNVAIAEILNRTAETGEYPKVIKQGILIPLQKPGKKKGPTEHIRPIILLSLLRKITSICMIRRTWNKIKTKIPLSQAAYQSGRSTTEQVYVLKAMAEKAVTSKNLNIHILMLDMSKAFDTVKREKLFEILCTILDKDELHMLKILLEDVTLQVKVGKHKGREFKTNIGVPQGDCLSPILFILYLAQALTETRNDVELEHNYSKPSLNTDKLLPSYLQEHHYARANNNSININLQYADDISWVSNAMQNIDYIKEVVPNKLREENLNINNSKTEEFNIIRGGNEDWKKCKYLGSMIDTEKDINRRKVLAISAERQLHKILQNRNVSLKTKIRIYTTFVQSIFLYNSELWTLTGKLEKDIDIFQRKGLRSIMNIRWPDKISNEDLYEKTNQRPWSEIIRQRRLSWFGHLLRLPSDTPAKQALYESVRKVKKPPGRPQLTWIALMKKELKKVLVEVPVAVDRKINNNEYVTGFEVLEELAKNRLIWRVITECVMSKDGERD